MVSLIDSSVVKVFAWQLFHAILPVMVNLSKPKISVDNACFYHGEVEEPLIMNHAMKASLAVVVWEHLDFIWNAISVENVANWLSMADNGPNQQRFDLLLVAVWAMQKLLFVINFN